MGNRKLNFWWERFRTITLVALITVWLLSGLLALYTLRQNNLTMLRKREAVFTADQSGVGLEETLRELQIYVTGHMNTRLPKLGDEKAVQLKYTYERLVAAEEARTSSERVRITNEATAICEASLPSVVLTQRAACVQNYIAARPVAERNIPEELYSFDFVSPVWSPDVAGWLVVFFFLVSFLLAIRIVVGISVRRALSSI